MVKLEDLKIDQLKNELRSRSLPTAGLKAELRKRLREEMSKEDINVDEHDFPEASEAKEENEATSEPIMGMLQQMMQQLLEQKLENKANAEQIDQKLQQNADQINQ